MRRRLKTALPLLIAGLLVAAAGCGGGGARDSHESHGAKGQHVEASGGNAMTNEATTQVRLEVHGMHCEGCVSAITKALGEREGVVAKEVSLADSLATVTIDPRKVTPADLKSLIEDLGYTVGEKI